MRHDWPVQKPIADLPIKMKENWIAGFYYLNHFVTHHLVFSRKGTKRILCSGANILNINKREKIIGSREKMMHGRILEKLWAFLIKKIISLALVGYEMIIAHLALCASLGLSTIAYSTCTHGIIVK